MHKISEISGLHKLTANINSARGYVKALNKTSHDIYKKVRFGKPHYWIDAEAQDGHTYKKKVYNNYGMQDGYRESAEMVWKDLANLATDISDYEQRMRDLAEFENRLDNNNSYTPLIKEYQDFISSIGGTQKQILANYHIAPKEKGIHYEKKSLEAVRLDRLNKIAANAKKSFILTRIQEEDLYAHINSWYTFLLTPTLKPEYYDYATCRGFRGFEKAMEAISRRVFKQAKIEGYYNKDKKYSTLKSEEKRSFFRYVGVNEEGEQNGRIHWHVKIYCRFIPYGFHAPTSAIYDTLEVDNIHDIWRYGEMNVLPIRYAFDDAFAKLHWQWPMQENEETGIVENQKVLPLSATSNYITKYFNKQEISKCQTKNIETLSIQINELIPYRVKMNRGFGTWRYKEAIQKMSYEDKIRFIMDHSRRLSMKHRDMKIDMKMMRGMIMSEIGSTGIFVKRYLALEPSPSMLRCGIRNNPLFKAVMSQKTNFGKVTTRQRKIEISVFKCIRKMDHYPEFNWKIIGENRHVQR